MVTRVTSIVASLAAALLACGQSSGPAFLKVPLGTSPQRGPSDAWVTLVEFADYECPFCRSAQPAVADIESLYAGDLRLVFKNLPLAAIHPHARAAAVAATCAGDQGFFWEMHDLLFQSRLDDASLSAAAAQVPGLDVPRWQACLTTPEPAARVDEDVALAESLGVRGTPTFVVNGVTIEGAVPESDLSAAVEHARATAIASGIPRAEYYEKAVLGK